MTLSSARTRILGQYFSMSSFITRCEHISKISIWVCPVSLPVFGLFLFFSPNIVLCSNLTHLSFPSLCSLACHRVVFFIRKSTVGNIHDRHLVDTYMVKNYSWYKMDSVIMCTAVYMNALYNSNRALSQSGTSQQSREICRCWCTPTFWWGWCVGDIRTQLHIYRRKLSVLLPKCTEHLFKLP